MTAPTPRIDRVVPATPAPSPAPSSVRARAGWLRALAGDAFARTLESRRGTIIVLALGVLAILAISAVSYVAIVRIDRTSVVAAGRKLDPQPQVNTVVSEIGSILTADLFGNKIVTSEVPARVWPSAFEDGDLTDRPHIDGDWANAPTGNNPNTQMIVTAGGGGTFTIAKADDAWLAATSPVIDELAFRDSYWPQITNLRSSWRYQPRSGGRQEQWKRDDGQFVDLMGFFRTPLANGNANASADLTAGESYGPDLGTAFKTVTGGAGPLDQRAPMRVYGTQMNRVENDFSDINSVSNDQERFWTDTDGDLRPDARWQRVDALGNAYGLTWVVAARVIDASSLINFNTSLSFPYRPLLTGPLAAPRTWADIVGTGETPADIDLFRFLGYAGPLTGVATLGDMFTRELTTAGVIWPTPLRTDRLMDNSASPALRSLMGVQLGFGPTMRNLSQTPVPANDPNYNPPYEPRLTAAPNRFPEQAYPQGFETDTGAWGPMDYPTTSQRAVWYRLLTADATDPAPRSVQPITIRDFADLHTFRGTNNTEVVGKIEQFADGTESDGYQPGTGNINAPYGPLRSREGTEGTNTKVARSPRSFGSPDQDDSNNEPGRPTLKQLKWDNRHLLTPVSGVGRISPVPVLNTLTYSTGTVQATRQPSYFDGQRSLTKINLPELEREAFSQFGRDTAQRVFDAFVWALAPLATDRPMSRELAQANLFNNGADTFARHYGGGADGPAAKLTADVPITSGSTYAVLKSLCLTANLVDALGGVSPLLATEAPTALRLYNDNANALPSQRGVPALGTRLAQGNIPPSALDNKVFGNPGTAGGVSVFGIDRQPYLVQASYYAFYEDSDAIGGGAQTVNIEPNDPAFKDQLGSIMAFEIRNPWPQAIDLSGYRILVRNSAIASSTPEIEFDLGAVSSGIPIVAGGGTTVLYFANGPTSTVSEMVNFWDSTSSSDDVLGRFEEMLAAAGTVAGLVPVRLDPNGVVGRVETAPGTFTVTAGSALPPVFASFLLGGLGQPAVNTMPVLLIRKGSAGGDRPDIVVDRLSPPSGAGPAELFPQQLTTNYTHTFVQETNPAPPPVSIDPRGRARVCVASSIYRPTNVASGNGMPPYIAERREANKIESLPLEPAGYLPGGATINRRQVWVTDRAPLSADPEPSVADLVLSGNGAFGPGSGPDWQSIGIDLKGDFTVGGVPYTGRFQLFNPTPGSAPSDINQPLPDSGNLPPPMPSILSAADLLLLPTVATVYVHADVSPADIRDAADLTLSYTGNNVAFATQLGAGRGAWVTASEMLGSDWELFRNPRAGTTTVNPYVGILDPTQSILSVQLSAQSQNLPDVLTIPLALRVIDAFDGLDHQGDLAPGRVNLNTAPPRVLATLPFLSPLTQIDNADDKDGGTFTASSLPAPTDPNSNPLTYPLLGGWLLPYRSLGLERPIAPPTSPDPAWRGANTTLTIGTNDPGLRSRLQQPKEFGLVSVGELGVMGRWDPAAGAPLGGGTIDQTGFLHIGANLLTERGLPFGRHGNPDAQIVPANRVRDSIEERTALLRALTNSTSTRSDVYVAWFVLRGYNPDTIESINVNAGGGPPTLEQARAAMNNERFRPEVETRWLVVYDRSNVRTPTDRPRVLVQMELPSAKP